MKSTNYKSGINSFKKASLLLVLASTMGLAQEARQTQETPLKTKSDLSAAGAQTNPYFVSNELAGEMTAVAGGNSETVEITKQKTKSNNTNERTTKPNGQDDGNPFPPKNLVKKGSPQIATYDVKSNKKI